jgi:hypothetical protein
LQIDIDGKHDVFMCSESIAKSSENTEDVKPPNEGIAGSALRVFHDGGYCKANTFNECCTHEGPRSNNRT